MSAAPALAGLTIAGDPAAWSRLGFAIAGDTCRIGTTSLAFEPGSPGGILEWTLAGEGEGDVDELPTRWVAHTADGLAPDHPNGALRLDHVVVMTPDVGRTTAALEALGSECRRVREARAAGQPVRQAFFRFGEVIVEVVGPPQPQGTDGARFWGLVVVVAELEACAARLGDDVGPVHAAVQPGRRIATVRRSSGIAVPLALMSPAPAR